MGASAFLLDLKYSLFHGFQHALVDHRDYLVYTAKHKKEAGQDDASSEEDNYSLTSSSTVSTIATAVPPTTRLIKASTRILFTVLVRIITAAARQRHGHSNQQPNNHNHEPGSRRKQHTPNDVHPIQSHHPFRRRVAVSEELLFPVPGAIRVNRTTDPGKGIS